MSVEINVVERIVVETTTPTILEVCESAIDVIEQTTTLVTEGETTVNIVDEATTVVIADDPISLVEIGIQGPQGAPAEDDLVFAKRVDFVGDDIIYRGEAVVGTLDAASAWRVRRITFVNPEDDVVEEWADGNAAFDKIWDDRAGFTYT